MIIDIHYQLTWDEVPRKLGTVVISTLLLLKTTADELIKKLWDQWQLKNSHPATDELFVTWLIDTVDGFYPVNEQERQSVHL